jgi:hypothetical protein
MTELSKTPDIKNKEVLVTDTKNGAIGSQAVSVQLEREKKREKIVRALTSPFNFYVRVPDLFVDNHVYFFAWSLGKVKNIIWGYYDMTTDKFMIEGECGYNGLNQISNILRTMTQLGYVVVFNIVQDLIPGVMRTFTAPTVTKDDSAISASNIIGPSLNTPDKKFIIIPEVTKDGTPVEKATQAEPITNRTDIDLSLLSNIEDEDRDKYAIFLRRISDKFLRAMETNDNYVMKTLSNICADPTECIKDQVINFLSSDITPEQVDRCKLYYGGEPGLRKSGKYQQIQPPVVVEDVTEEVDVTPDMQGSEPNMQ